MAEKVLSIANSITVGELAEVLNLPVTTLIGELFKNGIAATINQRIDFETATIIVDELGLDVELQKKEVASGAERKGYQDRGPIEQLAPLGEDGMDRERPFARIP